MNKSNMQLIIEQLLQDNFNLEHLEVINNSRFHSRGPDSHFKIIAASADFADLTLINRHRLINQILGHLINNPVHSFEYHLYDLEQWKVQPEINSSPKCAGNGHKSQK